MKKLVFSDVATHGRYHGPQFVAQVVASLTSLATAYDRNLFALK